VTADQRAQGSAAAHLRAAATARTQARGHELAPWASPPGEEAVGWATACVRCGRVAYVRAESRFIGVAGPALTESCDGWDEEPCADPPREHHPRR
jgi:hypothetical protein